MTAKEEIVVFSKGDLLDSEMKEHIVSEFKKKYPKLQTFVISAATGEGIDTLKDFLIDTYAKEEIIEDMSPKEEVKVYNLKDQVEDTRKPKITYEEGLMFRASGKRIEQIVRMTDFENSEAVMRVYDVLDKMGVIKDVEKQLAKILETAKIDNSFFFIIAYF